MKKFVLLAAMAVLVFGCKKFKFENDEKMRLKKFESILTNNSWEYEYNVGLENFSDLGYGNSLNPLHSTYYIVGTVYSFKENKDFLINGNKLGKWEVINYYETSRLKIDYVFDSIEMGEEQLKISDFSKNGFSLMLGEVGDNSSYIYLKKKL